MAVTPKFDLALGWLTGKLLVIVAKRAYNRGDLHGYNHIVAATIVGNTGPGSHSEECLADTVGSIAHFSESTYE